MKSKRITIMPLAALLVASLQAGEESGKLVLNDEMPALVKVNLDSRLRYEYGKEEGLDDSNAGTMRNRVGLLGTITIRAVVTPTVPKGFVFIPMHEESTNRLTLPSFDPHSRQPSYKHCAVRVTKGKN